jgi:hypothetical protein
MARTVARGSCSALVEAAARLVFARIFYFRQQLKRIKNCELSEVFEVFGRIWFWVLFG